MKIARFATLLLCLLPLLNLNWQENGNGNFEAWDNNSQIKMELSHGSSWNFMKNYVDSWTDDAYVFDAAYGSTVTITPILLVDPQQHTVDWMYLYYGDGTGTFVTNPGTGIDHTYDGKSRYYPALLAKIDGTIYSFGFHLFDGWTDAPTTWPRPDYTPPTTYNSALNSHLAGFAADNSTYTNYTSCACDSVGDCEEGTGGCVHGGCVYCNRP